MITLKTRLTQHNNSCKMCVNQTAGENLMTTLYAYWDKAYDQLASPHTISTTRRGCGEKLVDLLGEEYAFKLVADGKLFITEIKVERVV